MLPFFDDCLHAKNPAYWLISSWDIAQRILKCNWTRGTTGHTQSKQIVPDATFLWWLSLCKKSKRSPDSFQRHWWSKNGHNCFFFFFFFFFFQNNKGTRLFTIFRVKKNTLTWSKYLHYQKVGLLSVKLSMFLVLFFPC